MLNMIAGSVLPITAFIGVFFAFAATCILTSFLNDWLPRDMGREFAHNGKLSAGNQEVQGSFLFLYFVSQHCCLARCLWKCLFILFLFLLKC